MSILIKFAADDFKNILVRYGSKRLWLNIAISVKPYRQRSGTSVANIYENSTCENSVTKGATVKAWSAMEKEHCLQEVIELCNTRSINDPDIIGLMLPTCD